MSSTNSMSSTNDIAEHCSDPCPHVYSRKGAGVEWCGGGRGFSGGYTKFKQMAVKANVSCPICNQRSSRRKGASMKLQ